MKQGIGIAVSAVGLALCAQGSALAQSSVPAPRASAAIPTTVPVSPSPSPGTTSAPTASTAPVVTTPPLTSTPVVQPTVPPFTPVEVRDPVLPWTPTDAQALLTLIGSVDSEGLIPADYRPEELRAAIAAGPGPALDEAASRSFVWLAEDLRDGRTPVTARVQWFADDPDRDDNPTEKLMRQALDTGDVAGVLASLAPVNPDSQALKAALAATPATDKAARSLIRANMDRWRWLRRDLGNDYLLTNVPEFQLRITVNNRIIRSYRTVVGKPGRTATPQLAETIEAVVFNPTWTVPQSIVVGEGLGARLLANPASARAQGYKATRNADGSISVVQQPGANNALGLMKIDMPNPHAIYLHDTPAKSFFNHPVRAYSHGCVRTENAVVVGMVLAMRGADLTPAKAAELSRSGKYTRVRLTRTFPVYITYFTMARDIDGVLRKFGDIYGRDKPVLASFDAPRQLKTSQRISNEAIIKLDNPL
jgi:L,D-transpeptidase YcbB